MEKRLNTSGAMMQQKINLKILNRFISFLKAMLYLFLLKNYLRILVIINLKVLSDLEMKIMIFGLLVYLYLVNIKFGLNMIKN